MNLDRRTALAALSALALGTTATTAGPAAPPVPRSDGEDLVAMLLHPGMTALNLVGPAPTHMAPVERARFLGRV